MKPIALLPAFFAALALANPLPQAAPSCTGTDRSDMHLYKEPGFQGTELLLPICRGACRKLLPFIPFIPAS